MQTLIIFFILLHKKQLQFDWLRAVVLQLNLKYLHVKITFAGSSINKQQHNLYFWHNYHSLYFKLSQISLSVTYNNFEISLAVFMPNITTHHAITYTNRIKNASKIRECSQSTNSCLTFSISFPCLLFSQSRHRPDYIY